MIQKSILASAFSSQNLRKSLQNHEKLFRGAMQNEACFAMLCTSRGNRRKLTGVGVCKPSKGLRIGLGHLPLVALIINASS